MSNSNERAENGATDEVVDYDELLADVPMDEVTIAGIDLEAMPDGSILRMTEEGSVYEYIPLKMVDPLYLRNLLVQQKAGFPPAANSPLKPAAKPFTPFGRQPQHWQVGSVSDFRH